MRASIRLSGIGTAALTVTLSVAAEATPVRVSADEFSEILEAATSVLIENLEYEPHSGENPYKFLNGTLQVSPSADPGAEPVVARASCLGVEGLGETDALTVRSVDASRIFRAFPEGTTHWGASMCLLNPADVLEVTVVGGSGTLTFTAPPTAFASFLGLEDQTGLMSVSIRNLGPPSVGASNYYFDQITTAEGR